MTFMLLFRNVVIFSNTGVPVHIGDQVGDGDTVGCEAHGCVLTGKQLEKAHHPWRMALDVAAALVNATRASGERRAQLLASQLDMFPDLRPQALIVQFEVRWLVILQSVRRLLDESVLSALREMVSDGSLGDVLFPSIRQQRQLLAFTLVLVPFEQFVLRSQRVNTLSMPNIAYRLMQIERALGTMIVDDDEQDGEWTSLMARVLLDEHKLRFASWTTMPPVGTRVSLALLCAAVSPVHGDLTFLGIGASNIARIRADVVAEAVSLAHAKDPAFTKDVLLTSQFTYLFGLFDSKNFSDQFGDVDGDSVDEKALEWYRLQDDIRLTTPCVTMLLSIVSNTTRSECGLSSAGEIDSAKRNRMHTDTLRRHVVVRDHIRALGSGERYVAAIKAWASQFGKKWSFESDDLVAALAVSSSTAAAASSSLSSSSSAASSSTASSSSSSSAAT